MLTADEARQQEVEDRKNRFRILVCIDGSDESYACLEYAVRLGGGVDADIILLYVRPIDQGLRSGGLQVRVVRENMLKWGLELPGIQYLKKGRDMLFERGVMGEDWVETATHTDLEGDPLGDNKIEYRNDQGKSIVLKLKTASGIASGILDQYELGPYNLIIIGATGGRRGVAKALWDPAVADRVAVHAPCSVMTVRQLKMGRGHLICTDGSEMSMEMVRKDAYLASRCDCPISLLSVSLDVEGEPEAQRNVAKAKEMLDSMGIDVVETFTRVGDPVEEICAMGANYSVVVMSDTGRSGLQRFFMGSVAFKVLETAQNSVMIVR